MIIERLKAELDDNTREYDDTNQAFETTRAAIAGASRELLKLKAERPELLARIAMGHTDAAEGVQMRQRIHELHTTREELELAEKWLHDRLEPLRQVVIRLNQAIGGAEYNQEKYEKFKKFYPTSRNKPATHSELTELARLLECEDDLSAFLEQADAE